MATRPAFYRRYGAVLTAMRALERVSPSPAAALAYLALYVPGARVPVHPTERDTMERARLGELRVEGRRVVTYAWGSGPRTVLLVHGWQGRASSFAPLIRALDDPEVTVVAFDAPAHGASPGLRTDVGQYARVVAELGRLHGELDAVIAHSMGALAAMAAVSGGVRTRRLVTMSGMSDFGYALERLSDSLGFGAGLVDHVERHTVRRRFAGDHDSWRGYAGAVAPMDPRIPWLLVHDLDDDYLDISHAHRLAAANPHVRVVHTRGLGHARTLRDPQVVEAVARFLR